MQLKNEAAIVFFDVVGGPIVFFSSTLVQNTLGKFVFQTSPSLKGQSGGKL